MNCEAAVPNLLAILGSEKTVLNWLNLSADNVMPHGAWRADEPCTGTGGGTGTGAGRVRPIPGSVLSQQLPDDRGHLVTEIRSRGWHGWPRKRRGLLSLAQLLAQPSEPQRSTKLWCLGGRRPTKSPRTQTTLAYARGLKF